MSVGSVSWQVSREHAEARGTLEHWSGYSKQPQQNGSGGQEMSGLETDLVMSPSVQGDAERATGQEIPIRKAGQMYN